MIRKVTSTSRGNTASDSRRQEILSRVIPLRYPGGKFYALKFIMPFVNRAEHDEYREPFVGGGAVFFAKRKVQHNWLNDLDQSLMVTYQVMADPTNRKHLAELLGKEVATPKRHAEVKSLEPVTPLGIAFRTYYLNRTSFSGILHKPAWGYKIGQSVEPKGWPRKIMLPGMKLEGERTHNHKL
jgi:DNA adenine methylase